MEWLIALQGWIKTSAYFAPAAVIAAILAAGMPRRDGSIPGSVIGALVATPIIGASFLEWFPMYKVTSQSVGIAGGVSIYYILGKVPQVIDGVISYFSHKFGAKKNAD